MASAIVLTKHERQSGGESRGLQQQRAKPCCAALSCPPPLHAITRLARIPFFFGDGTLAFFERGEAIRDRLK